MLESFVCLESIPLPSGLKVVNPIGAPYEHKNNPNGGLFYFQTTMTINSPSGPSARVYLNPTIVMEKICYLKKEWESGRAGEWESGRFSSL